MIVRAGSSPIQARRAVDSPPKSRTTQARGLSRLQNGIMRLEVKDSEGWYGRKFPGDVAELHFQVIGVIQHLERLKALARPGLGHASGECRHGLDQRESQTMNANRTEIETDFLPTGPGECRPRSGSGGLGRKCG
jgi:hypothetical protein